MRFSRACRTGKHHDCRRPIGPGIDQGDGLPIRIRDDELVARMSRPMAEIERNLPWLVRRAHGGSIGLAGSLPTRRCLRLDDGDLHFLLYRFDMPFVERRFEVAGDSETDEHGDSGRSRDRNQQSDETEQGAEGKQREHQPYRVQADAFADQPGLENVALDELARKKTPATAATMVQSGQNCTNATPTDSTRPTSEPT